jgi:tetratricopeptide (TPR) repeat protein
MQRAEIASTWTVFCGAGISIDQPAGLPSALEVTQLLIESLVEDRGLARDLRALSLPDRPTATNAYDHIRFETLVEIIQDLLDPDLELLRFVDYGISPNKFHLGLADFASRGAALVTTNMDCLLEMAVLGLGLRAETVDLHERRLPSLPDDCINVVKLHGSSKAYSIDGSVTTCSSPQATIRAIGAASPHRRLPAEVLARLALLIDGRNVLVAGYSGQDDLDIVPSLMETAPRSVLWIMHADGPGVDVTDDYLRGDVERFESDRLQLWKTWDGVTEGRFRIVQGDSWSTATTVGIRNSAPSNRPLSANAAWRSYIASWARARRDLDPGGLSFAARSFDAVEQYRRAIDCFVSARPPRFNASRAPWGRARWHFWISQMAWLLDDLAHAEEEAFAACESGIDEGDPFGTAQGTLQVGRIAFERSQFEAARTALGDARQRFSGLGSDYYVSVVDIYRGLTEHLDGHARGATELLTPLVSKLESSGDLAELVDCLSALGTAFYDLFDLERALANLNAARDLADRLALTVRARRTESQIAGCYILQGRLVDAFGLLRPLASNLGPRDKSICLHYLGRTMRAAGLLHRAGDWFQRARVAVSDSTRLWTSEFCADIAEVQLSLGDRQRCIELLREADRLTPDECEPGGEAKLTVLSAACGLRDPEAAYAVIEAAASENEDLPTLVDLVTLAARHLPPSSQLATLCVKLVPVVRGVGNDRLATELVRHLARSTA